VNADVIAGSKKKARNEVIKEVETVMKQKNLTAEDE
jgi:hypothetical protein